MICDWLNPWMWNCGYEEMAVSHRFSAGVETGISTPNPYIFQGSIIHTYMCIHAQFCPTMWSPELQPARILCPWDFPGKNTGVGCHFLLQCVKVKSLSRVQLLATPWTTAYQTPLSMGFSRQEYWSGVPLPSPRHGMNSQISYRSLW